MVTEKEFTANYKKHKNFITSVLSRCIRNKHTVEDLVQQTFMRAWISRHTFEGRSLYRTWLYRIAVNVAFNYIATQKHRIKIIQLPPGGVENLPGDARYMYSVPLDNMCELETMQDIKKMIQKIPKKIQQPFVMFVLYGIELKQIAETLEIPLGTVKSRIFRAREILKTCR